MAKAKKKNPDAASGPVHRPKVVHPHVATEYAQAHGRSEAEELARHLQRRVLTVPKRRGRR